MALGIQINLANTEELTIAVANVATATGISSKAGKNAGLSYNCRATNEILDLLEKAADEALSVMTRALKLTT